NQDHVRWLDLPEAAYVISIAALLMNKAPHPNAAKLFMNWLLTEQGQSVFTQNVDANSRRIGVAPGLPDGVLKPGTTPDSLVRMNHYTLYPAIDETKKLLEELAKQRV